MRHHDPQDIRADTDRQSPTQKSLDRVQALPIKDLITSGVPRQAGSGSHGVPSLRDPLRGPPDP